MKIQKKVYVGIPPLLQHFLKSPTVAHAGREDDRRIERDEELQLQTKTKTESTSIAELPINLDLWTSGNTFKHRSMFENCYHEDGVGKFVARVSIMKPVQMMKMLQRCWIPSPFYNLTLEKTQLIGVLLSLFAMQGLNDRFVFIVFPPKIVHGERF